MIEEELAASSKVSNEESKQGQDKEKIYQLYWL